MGPPAWLPCSFRLLTSVRDTAAFPESGGSGEVFYAFKTMGGRKDGKFGQHRIFEPEKNWKLRRYTTNTSTNSFQYYYLFQFVDLTRWEVCPVHAFFVK